MCCFRAIFKLLLNAKKINRSFHRDKYCHAHWWNSSAMTNYSTMTKVSDNNRERHEKKQGWCKGLGLMGEWSVSVCVWVCAHVSD